MQLMQLILRIAKAAKVAKIGEYMNPLLLYLMFNPKYYIEDCLQLFRTKSPTLYT